MSLSSIDDTASRSYEDQLPEMLQCCLHNVSTLLSEKVNNVQHNRVNEVFKCGFTDYGYNGRVAIYLNIIEVISIPML